MSASLGAWAFVMALSVGSVAPAPVDAEVRDGYRPPQCVWCPGNRGIEYANGPGTEVRALRSGRVSFAGRVAGTGYVVLDIGGGLRVTYGGVDPARWRVGDRVAAGVVVALAEGPLHLGVRHRDQYVNPAILWQARTVRARLIPG